MEDAADACVKFVKLVDGPAAVYVPQNAVIQHQLISHVECRTIPRVVISTISIMQAGESVASRNVVDLATHETHNDVINSQSTCNDCTTSEAVAANY